MMFGFFQSKKKKAAVRQLESADSFYRTPDDDDLNMGDLDIDDDEYGRRVTEAITKLKGGKAATSVHGKSTPSSKPASKNPTPAASPARTPTRPLSTAATGAKGAAPPKANVAPISSKSTPIASPITPSLKATVVVVGTPVAKNATINATPVTAAPVAVAAGANRPNAAVSTPVSTPVMRSNVSARPNAATAAPNSAPSKAGFTADPKMVHQLVTMGFSFPAATLALMKTNNHVDQATEFLLEHSDAEMDQLITEAGGASNGSSNSSGGATPKAATPVTAAAAVTPRTEPMKRALSSKSNSIKGISISSSSASTRSYIGSSEDSNSPVKSPGLVRETSRRLSKPRDPAVDSAMAAILARREAQQKTSPNPSAKSPVATAVSAESGRKASPTKESTFDRLSNYKTKSVTMREEQEAEDRQRIEAQESRRKLLRDSSPAAAHYSPASPSAPPAVTVDNKAFEALHLKKTSGMVMAEEAEEARKAEIAAQEQRRKLLRDSSPGPVASTTAAVSSNVSVLSTTSSVVVDNSAYEKLHASKTRSMVVAEEVEEIRRLGRVTHEAEVKAQELRRRSLRESSPGGRLNTSSNSSVVSGLSHVDNSAFEELHLKKTRSMQLAEELLEKERQEQAALEAKRKKAATRGPDAASDGEVFEKLHTAKIASMENREMAVVEDRLRQELAEAHQSGRLGAAAVPPAEDSPLLRKTQSAYMRELLLEEERQRIEDERVAKELLRMEATGPTATQRRASFNRSRSSSFSAGRRMSEDLSSVTGGATNTNATNSSANLLDGIGATIVPDSSDTEEDDDDDLPTLNLSERTPTPQASHSGTPDGTAPPSRNFAHKNSDFFKFGQSFYADTAKSTSSKNKLRKSDSTSRSFSRSIPERIEDIVGYTKRTCLPWSVRETADHTWVGHLIVPANAVNATPETVIPLKGEYFSKEHCEALTTAQAPPVWVEFKKKATCRVCDEAFNKYLKAEHCHNCGQLVCADCSEETWPASMLSATFVEKNTKPRTCVACSQLVEKLLLALKNGDLDQVKTLQATGNVNLHYPFSLYPDAPYPIHCAAASGNLELLTWLVDTQYCVSRDPRTGEVLVNAAGHSVLAVAARKGDVAMMRYCLQHLHSSVTELTDVSLLQRGLHAALQAPGELPSTVHKKPPKSPLVSPNSSFRRFERLSVTTSPPEPPALAASSVPVQEERKEMPSSVPDTAVLQEKAAELAARLQSAQSFRKSSVNDEPSPATVSVNFPSPKAESAVEAVALPEETVGKEDVAVEVGIKPTVAANNSSADVHSEVDDVATPVTSSIASITAAAAVESVSVHVDVAPTAASTINNIETTAATAASDVIAATADTSSVKSGFDQNFIAHGMSDLTMDSSLLSATPAAAANTAVSTSISISAFSSSSSSLDTALDSTASMQLRGLNLRSTSQDSINGVHHRPPPLRSSSSHSLTTSPRLSESKNMNHSHSFVSGTKRMNSTKMEPPLSASPAARMTLPGGLARVPSNHSMISANISDTVNNGGGTDKTVEHNDTSTTTVTTAPTSTSTANSAVYTLPVYIEAPTTGIPPQ